MVRKQTKKILLIMKERMKDLAKRLKPKHTQNYDISKWVNMRYYQPFKIDETKLQMI